MKASTFAIALLCVLPALSFAQASRTWVSGVGDDANPCSRTAPCKTFAGAISKTAAGGEINALDPGGFGAVTITKSITLDGGSAFASILGAGTNGIVINVTTAPYNVTLRNLSIQGVGTGLSGIRALSTTTGTLHIENVQIRNYGASSSPAVNIAPGAALDLLVLDTVIENCAGSPGISLTAPASGNLRANISRVTVANCGTALAAAGAATSVRLSDSSLLDDNTVGCSTASGAVIQSFGNNRLAASCTVTSVPLR